MRRTGEFLVISILIVLGVLIAGGFLVSVRFLLGGSEDSWICEKGAWVKHGKPSSPQPTRGCGNQGSH